MTYLICGGCMHSRSSHTEHSPEMMYCSSCMKICDLVEYSTIHEPSKIICQDGISYNMGVKK